MVTEADLKNWYNAWVSEKGTEAWRPYEAYPVILDYLKVAPGKRLLDVRCGVGRLLKAAHARGLKTFGVDISDKAVELARKISPDSQITVGKGEELKFENETFDYLTCGGALEHFMEMEKGLSEMYWVTKADDRLCIIIPNSECLFRKIGKNKALFSKTSTRYCYRLKNGKPFSPVPDSGRLRCIRTDGL